MLLKLVQRYGYHVKIITVSIMVPIPSNFIIRLKSVVIFFERLIKINLLATYRIGFQRTIFTASPSVPSITGRASGPRDHIGLVVEVLYREDRLLAIVTLYWYRSGLIK